MTNEKGTSFYSSSLSKQPSCDTYVHDLNTFNLSYFLNGLFFSMGGGGGSEPSHVIF
jgi:hypothetical protein